MRTLRALSLAMCCMWSLLNPAGAFAGGRQLPVVPSSAPEHRTEAAPNVEALTGTSRGESEGTPEWMFLPSRGSVFASALERTALRFLGRPFQWAGIGHRGFDCSGLVKHVFAAVGVDLPHSSFRQFQAGVPIPVSALGPGDLVFFRTYRAGPSHVGIYLGAHRFIHASPSRGVIISSMDEPYFRYRFLGARRL